MNNDKAAGFMGQVYRRPIAALFLFCLLAWIPGFFTLPAMDRDESRFAQASKQMLETGNFVDIQKFFTQVYNAEVARLQRWTKAQTLNDAELANLKTAIAEQFRL